MQHISVTDRQTDGQLERNNERIDRQTMVKQNTPSPCEQGYNKTIETIVTILHNIISVSTK